MPIEISELIARIAADDSQFKAGMARVKASAAEAGIDLEAMGAKADAAFAGMGASAEKAASARLLAVERAAKGEQSIWAAEVEARRAADASMMASFESNQAKMTASAEAAVVRQRSLIAGLGSAFAGISAGIALVGVASIKMAADFDGALTRTANNAGLTNRELAEMKTAVLGLGKESGADLKDLADGFLHVHNFGFQGADAVKVLRTAMESAVATGAKTADTANLLAGAMKNMHIPVSQAGAAMNVLHLASQRGNMTLEQFNGAASKAFPTAAAYHVSLQEVSSALSAMTQHQIPANMAATQFNGIVKAIVNPTASAEKAIVAVSRASGVDLVHDFTNAGLATKGLKGIIDDINRATNDHADLIIKKLVPAQRGGLGMLVLAKEGYRDFASTLDLTNQAMAGKIDPTTKNYQRTLQTLQNSLERLWNEVKADFIPIGERLSKVVEDAIPIVRGMMNVIAGLMDGFSRLPQPIQDVIAAVGLLTVGFRALSSVVGLTGLTGAFTRYVQILKGVPAASAEAQTATVALNTSLGEMGLLGLLKAVPLYAAAAFVGWEIGSALDRVFHISDAISDLINKWRGFKDNFTTDAQGRPIIGESGGPYAGVQDLRRITVPFRAGHSDAMYRNTPLGANYAEHLEDATRQQAEPIARKLFGTSDLGALSAAQWDHIAGTISEQAHKLAAAFGRAAADGINTPEGQASCAYFASQFLDKLGAHLPVIGGAQALRDKVVAQGGRARGSQAEAQAGDLVVWHGPGYGANGSGYHVGVYLGNGMIEQSSKGITKTMPMYDRAHATFYSVPGTSGGASSAPPWLQAMADPMTAVRAAEAKEREKEQQREMTRLRAANTAEGKIDDAIQRVKTLIARDLEAQERKQQADWRSTNAADNRVDAAIERAKKVIADRLARDADDRERQIGSLRMLADMSPAGQGRIDLLNQIKYRTMDRYAATPADDWKERLKLLQDISQIVKDIQTAEEEMARPLGEKLKESYEQMKQSARGWVDDLKDGLEAAGGLAKYHAESAALYGPTRAQSRLDALKEEISSKYYGGTYDRLTPDLQGKASAEAQFRLGGEQYQKSLDLTQKLTDQLAKAKEEMFKAGDAASFYQTVLADLHLTTKDLTDSQKKLVEQIARAEQMREYTRQFQQVISGAVNDVFSLGGNPAGRIQDRTQLADLQRQQRQLLQQQQDRAYVLGQRGVPNAAGEAASEYANERTRLQQEIDRTQRAISNSALTIKNVFKTLWQDVSTGFQQMLIKMAEDWLKSQLMKLFTGLLGKLLGFALPGTGGAPGGGGGSSAASGGTDFSSYSTYGLQQFASGGSFWGGQPMVVGEQGPELILPRSSGYVVPNGALAAAGAGGPQVVNVTLHLHGVSDANSFVRSRARVGQELYRTAQSAFRRQGPG